MYILKMMGNDKYNITKEDFNLLSGKSGLIFIPTLGGLINASSISSVLPEELVDRDRIQNRDGQWCIQKFGQWYLESDNSIKVDVRYYPELLEQPEKKELPSKFAKELSNGIS